MKLKKKKKKKRNIQALKLIQRGNAGGGYHNDKRQKFDAENLKKDLVNDSWDS